MSEVLWAVGGCLLGAFSVWIFLRQRGQISVMQAEARKDAELAAAAARIAALETQLSVEGGAAAGKLELLEDAKSRLSNEFEALSAKALRSNNQSFLELAKETFGKFQTAAEGDLGQRQEAIATLLKPLQQQLETYQQLLSDSERGQTNKLGEVTNHLEVLTKASEGLSNETQRLRRMLGSSQTRGRWGEETLLRVIEAAEMSAHCDFDVQVQSGGARPDLIVQLTGDRKIIVDAKVPDLEFLNALDEADGVKRASALAQHAARLKETVNELAAKDYPKQFPNSLDYVVLFLPAESLFSAALEGDRSLIVYAASKRIILATPASLLALLVAVKKGWQQYAQTKDQKENAAEVLAILKRMKTFVEHLAGIHSGLTGAVEAFNRAVGSYKIIANKKSEKLQRFVDAEDVQPPELKPIDSVPNALPETKSE